MNETPRGADMLAATRSVQAGRLTEATALLRRLLRGEPDSAPGDTAGAPAQGGSRIIDLAPETLEVTEQQPAPTAGWPVGRTAATAQPPLPEALRGFLERFNGGGFEAGLGGLAEPFPAPAPEPVPNGAKFLAGSYGDQAGSRAYKLYVPSTHRGQPAPLVVMLHGCTQSPQPPQWHIFPAPLPAPSCG
jgi:hypothetical protein